MSTLEIIGRAIEVDLPNSGIFRVPAKVDTGADSSAIWASHLAMSDDGVLSYVLFNESSKYYTGKVEKTKDYAVSLIRVSSGHRQVRYRVKISVTIQGRKIRGSFTLSDRSAGNYPILLGCKILNNKFLVDVSRGRIKKNNDKRPLNDEMKLSPKEFFDKYHLGNERGDI